MIDRLELIVPDDVPKRTENWHVQRMRHAKGNSPYAHTLDESLQLALRIHYDFRVPIAKERRHVKVDFTDTRLLSAEDLLWRLTWMFRIGSERALSFRVARIDFAADVHDVPVEWFRQHCLVQRKRKPQSYEVCNKESSKGAVTSVIFGKRPDLYRIYNRVAEKAERGSDILYDGMFSNARLPVVTRVERQCSGRAIPKAIETLGGLFKSAAALDPFPALRCRDTDDGPLSADDWPPQKWLMSVGLATVVKELGEATVRARLNRKGNAKRLFERYSDLLNADSPGVTADRLREIYRKGTVKQLNSPCVGPDGVISYPARARMLIM